MTASDTPTHAPELARWKLVPKEAASEMIWAGIASEPKIPYPGTHHGLWATYLKNAPSPPVDVATLLGQIEVLRRALSTIDDLAVDGTLGRYDAHAMLGSIRSEIKHARAALNLTGGRQP